MRSIASSSHETGVDVQLPYACQQEELCNLEKEVI
jgi:hypothetical protein